MIKVAFGSVPKDGGTFTFYRNQAPELLKLGVEMFCVSTGLDQASLWEEDYADDHCVLLAKNTNSIKKQSKAFIDWCIEKHIDIVIGVNSQAILSAIPHLPSQMKVVSRAANAFDHGYRITLSGGERISKIVALVPRLKNDLVEYFNANESKIVLIPNGIAPEVYKRSQSLIRGEKPELQLGFIGRLEHEQKGVFYLKEIADELDRRGINYKLKIAGKGKHGPELKDKLHKQVANGSVEFLGSLNPQEVVSFFESIDIQLFVSHFEGCPNALLEGMMAGCVPVVYNIPGITDFLIEDKKTGFLCTMPDHTEVVDSIEFLDNNRAELRIISSNGLMVALGRFTNAVAAQQYAKVFKEVLNNSEKFEPLPWTEFKADPNFEKSKWSFIPMSFRNKIKSLLGK